MRFGSRLAALFLIVVIAISTCSRAPAVVPDPGAESADPEVGGGAGADSGPQTPVPTPTLTREASPRLEGAGTALATPDIAQLPPATATVTPTAIAPTAVAPTTEPPTVQPATVEPATALPLATAPPDTTAAPSATPEPPTPTASLTPGGERIHVVQTGENLYRIGLLYGLSWVAIAEYNAITDPNSITVGQELRIPPSPTPTATATPETEARADEQQPAGQAPSTAADVAQPAADETQPVAIQESAPPVVTVAAGDTLYGISRQYGVDWAQVAEANGLATPNQLYPGQLLKIPPDVPGPTPEFNHRVHDGETLSKLAQQYGLPADELAEANGLAAPYTIYSGQTLVIPSDE